MNRRTLLRSLPICLLAGCVSSTSSAIRDDKTPTAVRTHSETFSAEIIDTSIDKPYTDEKPTPPKGDNGRYKQTATATFHCDSNTATIEGWLHTSSCRTIAIESLSFDEETNRVTLTLYPEWDVTDPPEEVACAGAKYHYRIRLKLRDLFPAEVHVKYRWPDEKKKKPFETTILNNC